MSAIPKELDSTEVKKLTRSTQELADSYTGFTVATAMQYTNGAEHLKRIKAAQKELEAEQKKIQDPINAALKATRDFFRPFSDRLAHAEAQVKRALTHYKDEEDRKAREFARIARERADREAYELREKARKEQQAAAAKERARIAKEEAAAAERARKERERLEAERKAAAEDQARLDRIAEEEAAAARREAEEQERLRLKREAAEAEQMEMTAKAENLIAQAEAKMAVPVQSAAPSVSGISTRKVWKFEITDPSKVPEEYKTIDEKKIGGVVRALKDSANIPGVRVYAESSMAAGSQ